ncbi:MAG TPA: tRNA (uridine(54)-C5)-methyltransferase TrmA [Cellvibrionaceae bacterium]|nr:tRNA (uridine(54)-C5)-methyltransferase TrmA [Cellvibrionaceae bacterium]
MTPAYQQQLDVKIAQLTAGLEPFTQAPIEVFASPEQHYRMRAEFKIWQDYTHNCCQYAMFEAGSNRKSYTLETFPAASKGINQVMPELIAAINRDECLRRKLFQIEFLSSTQGEVLASLIYHRPLDDAWQAAAHQVAQALNIHIVGRARGSKRVISQDYVLQTFSVNGRDYSYRHSENSFTQPNGPVCAQMLNWADQQARQIAEGNNCDLLELYCGNGNFTLPLSHHFRKVLANEIAKISLQDAQYNMAQNNIHTIQLARMSSEELTQALLGTREFRRLEGVNLRDYQFGCVFVDPPRAGLDGATLEFIRQFPFIIYISCNHHTLTANLAELDKTHQVEHAALFDQFPFTEHMEAGVVLKRRA